MPERKTKLTNSSVLDFLNTLDNEQVRQDCLAIIDIMQAATKAEPKMWGSSIVGFGTHRITYAGGREEDWMLIGFSPRKQNIALYGIAGLEQNDELLAKLGKYSRGKGCLYIKRLSDVHPPTLKKLIQESVKHKLKTGSPMP